MTHDAGRRLHAGVMSGTSLDGVDAVVAAFDRAEGCETLGRASLPFPTALRDELLALQAAGDDELERAARASNALADLYADAIAAACEDAGLSPSALAAAGVHGQTVRHRPEAGYTIQLNNPSRIAERAGVTVVADFRARDVAAGGEGAPLVPAFHRALFGDARQHRVVVNVGGIANVTDLPPGQVSRGFDTGPGNVLVDLWHARHRDGAYDAEGRWAASGRVDDALLRLLLADPYFDRAPPKSTGRDLFNDRWLGSALSSRPPLDPADVQATLLALTVATIAQSIERHAPAAQDVLVCGGGAHNRALMGALAAALAPRSLRATAALGVPPGDVEALAFAWLARETLAGRPGNVPDATGARGPRVLGGIYPA